MVTVLRDPKLEAIVRHHHERLDGSGYPDGPGRASAIPLGREDHRRRGHLRRDHLRPALPGGQPAQAGDRHPPRGGRHAPRPGRRASAFCANYAGRRPLALWSFVCGLPSASSRGCRAASGPSLTRGQGRGRGGGRRRRGGDRLDTRNHRRPRAQGERPPPRRRSGGRARPAPRTPPERRLSCSAPHRAPWAPPRRAGTRAPSRTTTPRRPMPRRKSAANPGETTSATRGRGRLPAPQQKNTNEPLRGRSGHEERTLPAAKKKAPAKPRRNQSPQERRNQRAKRSPRNAKARSPRNGKSEEVAHQGKSEETPRRPESGRTRQRLRIDRLGEEGRSGRRREPEHRQAAVGKNRAHTGQARRRTNPGKEAPGKP